MHDNHYNGILAMIAGLGGVAISYMDALTPFLRFGSLCLGFGILAITFYAKIRQEIKKDDKRN